MKINFNPAVVNFGTSYSSGETEITKTAPRVLNPYYDDSVTFLRKYYTAAQQLAEEGKTKEIFELFGIKCRQLPLSKGLIIEKYQQPNKDVTYYDLGIDENKLLEKVVRVNGDVDFSNSRVTGVKNLRNIGGHLKAVDYKRNIDFSSLESIGSNIDISGSKIEAMPKLKYIGGWAHFDGSEISDLGSLECVKNWMSVSGTPLSDLPSIKYIGRDFAPSGAMTIDTAARIKSKEQNLPYPAFKLK